mmetsp:Transcript_13613/g.57217  ORF Transcript_13613/g.57217 Transcript_13613/m.57217 type:complete len:350 (-) Transcript_13613:750-1799(-)
MSLNRLTRLVTSRVAPAIRRFVKLVAFVALSRIASAAVTAGKPGHARVSRSRKARTKSMSPFANSSSSSFIASCACTNAYSKLFRAICRKSSLLRPQDAAASAYSRDKVVSNTPGSSVAIVNGWPARCTFARWCRAAADAADIFTSPLLFPTPSASETPPVPSLVGVSLTSRVSFSTESVTTLLVMHSSIGIFEARSCAHSASSRVVATQCPNRSGLNRSIAASSPRLTTSPQCSVTGRPFFRASFSAGSSFAKEPTDGSPERSTPTTPQSVSRRYAASRTVRFASATLSLRSTERIRRATNATSFSDSSSENDVVSREEDWRPFPLSRRNKRRATCAPSAIPRNAASQ